MKFKTRLATIPGWATVLLVLCLAQARPALVRAQDFTYEVNGDDTISITGYTGDGGAVTIPSTISGLPVTCIEEWAFSGQENLTGVTIPNSVTSIGDLAFAFCAILSAITVEALNTSYSSVDGVLFNKSHATLIQYPGGKTGSYTIPGSVTRIGESAFEDCTSLTAVTIPNSVTNIEGLAFSSCTSLTTITIPNSVTRIGGGVFEGCTALTSAVIGNSVTSIGDGAFNGCTSLTTLTIPDSVTSIGDSEFLGCTSLSTITIPNGVTSIGTWAFNGCTSLTTITIPNSVTSIGDRVFADCAKLSAITVEALNTSYSSVDGVLFDKSPATLIQYPGGKAGSYTIPNGVTSIGGGAFERCASLTTITIPNSVTSIGDGAFEGCTSLTTVTIPDSVTSIGDDAFSYCTALTSAVIGNSVTSIGVVAFYGCTSVTMITIPNSVTSIGGNAFAACAKLSAITVEALNTSFSSVDGVLFDKSHATLIQYPGGKAGSYTIPDSVTGVGGGAFYGCTSLTAITIPNSVTSIGDWAFAACAKLSAITVEALNASYSSVDGVLFDKSYATLIQYPGSKAGSYTIPDTATIIWGGAFSGCTSLTAITIPNSVTSIGDSAFASCTGLSSAVIGNSVTGIGNSAFSGCTGFTAITIPNSVTSIGDGAFATCTGLSSAVIGNSVTSIGGRAFSGCTSLTTITIPNSVTSIGSGAFFGCSSLTGVYFERYAPTKLRFSGFLYGADKAVVYYLPGTTGWGPSFGGHPAVLWNPQVDPGASFGVRAGQFGFTITGSNGLVIVVEASADLLQPIWTPVGTNILSGGSSDFSDIEWSGFPSRFYRLRSP